MFARSLSSLRWLRRLLLAVVVTGSWTLANAAVYRGVWDPAYGPDFPNLGWGGSADFFVPESCIPSGDGVVLNNPFLWLPNCAGQAVVTSAQVQLYNLTGLPAVSATLDFDESTLDIIKLSFEDGNLDQLLTTPSAFVSPDGGYPGSLGVSSTTEFSLIFTLDTFLTRGGGPRLVWRDCGPSESEEYMAYSTNYRPPRCAGGINSNAAGNRPTFTITRVPEPATLGLVGVALASAASVGARRRRRSAAA